VIHFRGRFVTLTGSPATSPTGFRAYGGAMALWIGTSGWQYRHWRERFYPRGLDTARWLDVYAEHFDTVELNVTFYRQPKPAVFEAWARRVPPDFRFAVKASRYLTHIRRLREPRESVERLLEGACRLGHHLGPILVQLPPNLEVDADALAATLDAFPPSVQVAVEPRHGSWYRDDVRALLADRGATLCWADRRGALTPTWRTAAWGYVRFHEGRAMPRPCYGEAELAAWADPVAAGWPPDAEVYAYFNNDPAGCALRDAAAFARLAADRGLRPTRAPDEASIRVG
jgi:uncharacterized protein YecE (DUF72 family)